jgi:hypothetical protein
MVMGSRPVSYNLSRVVVYYKALYTYYPRVLRKHIVLLNWAPPLSVVSIVLRTYNIPIAEQDVVVDMSLE